MIETNEVEFTELIEWIDTITEWKDDKNKKRDGNRTMIDMLALIKKYYYHTLMKGSNSIKVVLPSIFTTSKYIKERYSKAVGSGINLKDEILWKLDEKGSPKDPYKLLNNFYENLEIDSDELLLESGKIQDGAAALIAYSKLQFTEMKDMERNAIISSLLQYCELDTLAMVMIYEHWINNT